MSALAGQTYFSTGGAEEEQDVDLVEQGGVQVATNLYKKVQFAFCTTKTMQLKLDTIRF